MKKPIAFSAILLGVMLLSACGSGFKADHAYPVESFEFTDQNDVPFSSDELDGTVWLAQFVFTNCTSICPPMMMNMADLQEKLQKEGVEDYKIVSFSVDPDHDTPEKMKQYLEAFGVPDESKWIMLTGYDLKDIEDLSANSFKMPVIDDPNSDQVIHGGRFGLVNQKGKVVKTYLGSGQGGPVPYDEIVSDMKALIKEGK